jgi:hypothetical protein
MQTPSNPAGMVLASVRPNASGVNAALAKRLRFSVFGLLQLFLIRVHLRPSVVKAAFAWFAFFAVQSASIPPS